MAQTTQRKRVTPQDIKKREIKLDIVEMKKAPLLPVWYLMPAAIPVVLWLLLPAHAGLWLALTATLLWAGFAGMVMAEQERDDLEVDREIVLEVLKTFALGLTLGAWALCIVGWVA